MLDPPAEFYARLTYLCSKNKTRLVKVMSRDQGLLFASGARQV